MLTTKPTSISLLVRHSARLARAAGVVFLTLGLALIMMGKADAVLGTVSGTNGTITIAQQDGQTPMNSGGSQATFYLNLSNSPGKPAADCSADSATGSTFVYSYAVQQTVDPTTLSFASGHPAGTGAAYGSTAFGLFQQPAGNYYGGQTTAVGTGQVQTNSLGFQWNPPLGSNRASNLLYSGGGPSSWNAGIACWNSATSKITDIWNTVITFSPSTGSGADPAGYTWTANASSTSTSTTTSTTPTSSSSSTTTPTTVSSTTMPTTAPVSQGTPTSSDATTTVSTSGSASGDSGGTAGASGNASTGAASTGSSASLPLTGAPVRLELNIGIGTLWLGFAVLLLSVVLPRKTSRPPRAGI